MPTTLIFYGRDGQAAKALAVKCRFDKKRAHIRHAPFFSGEKEPADAVVILPCVHPVHAERIRLVYGLSDSAAQPAEPAPEPAQPEPERPARKVTPKGRGRGTKYYVTEGDEIVSGPYDSRGEANEHL